MDLATPRAPAIFPGIPRSPICRRWGPGELRDPIRPIAQPRLFTARPPLDLISRTGAGFASAHPDEVKGIVFLDVITPELRAQMTPEQWAIFKSFDAQPAAVIAKYPAVEQLDLDQSLDQTAAAAPLKPMPVVVLTASQKLADVLPQAVKNGEAPPGTPPDFGAVLDQAQSVAQNQLAALVPGAVHITNTNSGHNIMIDNAPVVINAIHMVVDAVRAGKTSLSG